MTSTEALAFAHAHAAVDRALECPEETKEGAFNAFLGFKRLGAPSHVIKDLLVGARLRVDNAQSLLEDRMQEAKVIRGALSKVADVRWGASRLAETSGCGN